MQSTNERPDFVLVLTDVSSSLRSRARRLITSVATLGLLRTPSGAADVNAALGRLNDALESNGFRVLRVISGSESMEAGGAADDVLLLLHGSDARLHREYYREQLDAWIQSRTSAHAEFTPHDAPAEGFTPARRTGLLHLPLMELIPRLRALVHADLAVLGAFPPQHRRFCATLLAHLCRRPLLQAQHLHAVRSEYGEKVRDGPPSGPSGYLYRPSSTDCRRVARDPPAGRLPLRLP